MTWGRALSALIIGTLFGLGLAVSQMANPVKVLAFLNLAGGWDPSLLLVMAAAVGISFVGLRIVRGRAPLLDPQRTLPSGGRIDARLISGAALFGVGWGLAGYCPGPAIVGLSSHSPEPWLFVAAMLVGSLVAGRVARPAR